MGSRAPRFRLFAMANPAGLIGTIFSLDRRRTTMASSSSEDSRRRGDREDGMAQITLNEGLAWLKTLKKRHEELITLGACSDYSDTLLERRVRNEAPRAIQLWGSRGGVRNLVGAGP